jgi:Vitamin K epoxide reductase family
MKQRTGTVIALGLFGMVLSIYALYVKSKAESAGIEGYTAACDFSAWISCSKVRGLCI